MGPLLGLWRVLASTPQSMSGYRYPHAVGRFDGRGAAVGGDYKIVGGDYCFRPWLDLRFSHTPFCYDVSSICC